MSSMRRGSAMSLVSHVTFAQEEEPRYEEMSDEDLRRSLELAVRTNKVLTLENNVFERYLSRNDPQCLVTMNQALESARHARRVTSHLAPMSSVMSVNGSSAAISVTREKPIFSPSTNSSQTFSGSRRYTSGLSPSSSNKGYRITLSHRIEMANKEIDELKRSLAELEQSTIKKRANLRARMEEIELRIRETYEAREELEENIVKKGVDPLTGKIPAEKFVRFMEEWLKAADSIIEKLRLKSSTMKIQIKKAKHQLRQREELGESLHAIDFQQLAIENQDYVKQIEEKNQHLLDLKKMTGHYNIALTTYKQKLSEQMASLKAIKKEIGVKKNQIDKLEKNRATAQIEVGKAEKQLADIMQIMEEYEVPNVLDFVKIQAELREMKKTYKRLERHKNIQMNALKSFKKQHDHHHHMGMKGVKSGHS